MATIRPNAEPAATTVAAGDIFLIDGATGVRALAASSVPVHDANGNAALNNLQLGYTTTATAAGTTVFTAGSTWAQYFTGSTTQTITLPDVTTLKLGHSFYIQNSSTGALTVNSSGSNLVETIAPGASALVSCILLTGTTAASWSVKYHAAVVASGKALTVSNSLTLAGVDGTTQTFPGSSGLLTLNSQLAERVAWNSEYVIWNRGTTLSGLTTGTATADGTVNGPGVGATFTVSQVALTQAQIASIMAALPAGSDRPRYAKNLTWSVAPTGGENRTGYTGYFSTEEMNLDSAVSTSGQTITVSVVLWTNPATSVPNTYLYVAQEIGTGGTSGVSTNTISGTGAGTDGAHLSTEVFNRSTAFGINSTPTLYTFTITLPAITTFGTAPNLIIGIGVDYTAVGSSQQINYTALKYDLGSAALPWHRTADSISQAAAFGYSILNNSTGREPAVNTIWYQSATDIADGILPVGGAMLNANSGGVPAMTTSPVLGLTGSAIGSLAFANLTSGTIKLQPATGALGSAVLTLPAATGTLLTQSTWPLFTHCGYTATITQGSTVYMNTFGHESTETPAEQVMPIATTLSNMRVKNSSVGGSAQTIVYTLYKNGSPTTLTCTVATGSTTANDLTHTVTFAAGDTFSVQAVLSATTGTLSGLTASFQAAS